MLQRSSSLFFHRIRVTTAYKQSKSAMDHQWEDHLRHRICTHSCGTLYCLDVFYLILFSLVEFHEYRCTSWWHYELWHGLLHCLWQQLKYCLAEVYQRTLNWHSELPCWLSDRRSKWCGEIDGWWSTHPMPSTLSAALMMRSAIECDQCILGGGRRVGSGDSGVQWKPEYEDFGDSVYSLIVLFQASCIPLRPHHSYLLPLFTRDLTNFSSSVWFSSSVHNLKRTALWKHHTLHLQYSQQQTLQVLLTDNVPMK